LSRFPDQLSNFDIDAIVNLIGLDQRYGGTFSKDEAPKTLKSGKFCIINLQDSKAGGGTHWTAFYLMDAKTVVYFDSYGCYPPEEVVALRPNVLYQTDEIQKVNDAKDKKCGWYCLAFAQRILKKVPLEELTDGMTSKIIRKIVEAFLD